MPWYESDGDRRKEQAVIARFCEHAGYVPRKLPDDKYRVDFALDRDGKVAGWAEVKCRGRRYDTLIIDLRKVASGVLLAAQSGKPFFVVVEWPDGIAFTELSSIPERVAVGGRADRGDKHDTDVVAHIPLGQFTYINA